MAELPEAVLGLEVLESEPAEGEIEPVVTYIFLNGGDIVDSQTVRDGEIVTAPPAPEGPEGQAFSGWYIGEEPLFKEGETAIASASRDVLYVYVEAVFEDVVDSAEQPEEQPAPAEEGHPEEPAAPAEEGHPEEPAAPKDDEHAEEQIPSGEETGQSAETEGEVSDSEGTEDGEAPAAVPGLVYTGEAQPLVAGGRNAVFSLDSESYSPEIPTATNAGEYIVHYMTEEDPEPRSLAVVISKADVVLIAPTASID